MVPLAEMHYETSTAIKSCRREARLHTCLISLKEKGRAPLRGVSVLYGGFGVELTATHNGGKSAASVEGRRFDTPGGVQKPIRQMTKKSVGRTSRICTPSDMRRRRSRDLDRAVQIRGKKKKAVNLGRLSISAR